jgi:hypothetical protein
MIRIRIPNKDRGPDPGTQVNGCIRNTDSDPDP